MNTHKAINRTKSSENNNTLIKKGLVPGIIYGKGTTPLKIALEDKILSKLIQEGGFYTKILNIEIEGKTEKVLPKDTQYHPLTDKLIHFDLLRVQENTKVTVEVPVQFLNQDISPGLKQGGVLNIVRRSIELICNAYNIPEKLDFDLSESEIGDAIKISNINIQEDVKPTITDRDFVIATLVPPTVEVEPEPETAAEGEGEVEGEKVEGEEKTEESKEAQAETKEEKDPKEQKEQDKK